MRLRLKEALCSGLKSLVLCMLVCERETERKRREKEGINECYVKGKRAPWQWVLPGGGGYCLGERESWWLQFSYFPRI